MNRILRASLGVFGTLFQNKSKQKPGQNQKRSLPPGAGAMGAMAGMGGMGMAMGGMAMRNGGAMPHGKPVAGMGAEALSGVPGTMGGMGKTHAYQMHEELAKKNAGFAPSDEVSLSPQAWLSVSQQEVSDSLNARAFCHEQDGVTLSDSARQALGG
jgi:hypothetical protein